jgi:hypothetical protein
MKDERYLKRGRYEHLGSMMLVMIGFVLVGLVGLYAVFAHDGMSTIDWIFFGSNGLFLLGVLGMFYWWHPHVTIDLHEHTISRGGPLVGTFDDLERVRLQIGRRSNIGHIRDSFEVVAPFRDEVPIWKTIFVEWADGTEWKIEHTKDSDRAFEIVEGLADTTDCSVESKVQSHEATSLTLDDVPERLRDLEAHVDT